MGIQAVRGLPWARGRRLSGGTAEGPRRERPKILMDSPEDADIFHGEDMKVSRAYLAWQQDLEADDKGPTLDRPTVFRWTGDGKEVYLSGSFNNWANKIPLTRSQNTFVAIVDLPEGEHQYKFYVDGQWTHDPTEPVITSQLGTVNNVIQVKKTDFEVFDALMVDSQKCSDMSDLSSSPPGPYHQDAYVPKQEEKFKSPPILPPPSATAQSLDYKALNQFRNMILCVMPDSWPIFDYADYGCYCGKGGSGTPVDDLDRCCQVHDQCYSDAMQHPECWPILDNPYTELYTLQL
ncbi:5'-AMP-activated protein kinase subunit beta-1 [Nibea albiflora]|nr:5'-AMP-activated protein kinase subunit beta-1 [Nibea albiflora]